MNTLFLSLKNPLINSIKKENTYLYLKVSQETFSKCATNSFGILTKSEFIQTIRKILIYP